MSEIIGRNDNRRFLEEFGQEIFDEMENQLKLGNKQKSSRVELLSRSPGDRYGFTSEGIFLVQGVTLVEFETYLSDVGLDECIDILGYSHTDMYYNISSDWKREIKINRLVKKD
jgi:hypothetical protein